MYINDCIRCVKRYYPSEYSDEEMYIWCDEVSSMLAVEDRNVFREVILKPDKNGTFLLPEGVDIENVSSVSVGGRALAKSDIRNFLTHCGDKHSGELIRVVYLQPYCPIRRAEYSGKVRASENGSCFEIPVNEFMAGDIISIDINNGAHTAEAVPLFETEYTSPAVCVLRTSETGIADGEYADCRITRHITDETVCQAPYDSMYIDYILAKINMLQRDMQGYNHHMTAFNSRLSAYRKWLINHMPPCGGVLKNWW